MKILEDAQVDVSMDGKGRATDNIVIERFWRTLKYDEVYLKDYESISDASAQIASFIAKYNDFRLNSSCGNIPPMWAYTYSRRDDKIPA